MGDPGGTVAEGVLPAKQLRSQKRQRAILDAAHRLLEARGYDSLKMEDIAAEAGSSVGAVYQRFRNKEGLLDAMLQEQLDSLQQLIETRLTANMLEDGEGRAIRTLVELIVNFMRDNQNFMRALTSRQLAEPIGVTPLQKTARAAISRTWEVLRRARPSRENDGSRDRFLFAMQMVIGTCTNAVLNRPGPLLIDDPRLTESLSVAVETLLAQDTLRL
ncbi:MAG: TetR/AcrR family transcriptional regulator [Minwuia sp.]|uniref:TetR/AcrR family transcriptional regulator n=1 Tax=Minwuia sp. TaxID=2493630 RepID=UPI003A887A4B